MATFLDLDGQRFDAIDIDRKNGSGEITLPVGDTKRLAVWDVDGVKSVKPKVYDKSLLSVAVGSPQRAPKGKKGEIVEVTLTGLKAGGTAVTFTTTDDKKRVDKGDQLDVTVVDRRTVSVNLFVSDDVGGGAETFEKLFKWVSGIYHPQTGISFQLTKPVPTWLKASAHGLGERFKTTDALLARLEALAKGRNPDRFLNVFIVRKWGGLGDSKTKAHVADAVWRGNKYRCCVCVWSKDDQNIGTQLLHELGHLLLLDAEHADSKLNVMNAPATNSDRKITRFQAARMHENLSGITYS